MYTPDSNSLPASLPIGFYDKSSTFKVLLNSRALAILLQPSAFILQNRIRNSLKFSFFLMQFFSYSYLLSNAFLETFNLSNVTLSASPSNNASRLSKTPYLTYDLVNACKPHITKIITIQDKCLQFLAILNNL
jgi:hypothetical protein